MSVALQALQADLTSHVFAAPVLSVEVVEEPRMQARALLDERVIEVTSALQRHPWTDDELYAILAHEAFHLVLHARRRCGLTPAEQQEQELEADREAATLMARTGRPPQALIHVLSRLSEENLGQNELASNTHPEFSDRINALMRIHYTDVRGAR